MHFWSDIFIFLYIFICCASGTDIDVLHRNKRQLLFPNSTLLQFNAGVGTPSLAKDINVNFAFQANFQLPWNRTQIPVDILNVYPGYTGTSRKKRESDYENDAQLFHLYKYVEDVLNSFGHDGHSCVKQALCQIGAQPLHSEDDEDLLHELASFVLNPTNNMDDGQVTAQHTAYPYIQAHKHGRNSHNCVKLYEKCKFSLVEMFSKLHQAPS